ncbi:hypothetical protein evm_000407 [Chilo suppressalis]|nr:hypothetical protein evm_000407 [Chilo suppressalis]
MGDQKFLSRAPPCFGRHVKPLVPAASAVVSTRQSALRPRGEWPSGLKLMLSLSLDKKDIEKASGLKPFCPAKRGAAEGATRARPSSPPQRTGGGTVGTRPRILPPRAGHPAHVCGVPAIPRETPAVEPGLGREAAGCGDAEESLNGDPASLYSLITKMIFCIVLAFIAAVAAEPAPMHYGVETVLPLTRPFEYIDGETVIYPEHLKTKTMIMPEYIKSRTMILPEYIKDKFVIPEYIKDKITVLPEYIKDKITLLPEYIKDKITVNPKYMVDKTMVLPESIKARTLVVSEDIKDKTVVLPELEKMKLSYDPEYFYDTHGFYPDH